MRSMSESPVIAFLNKMTDLILLNLIYIVCCLPVVTIGAATTAMYYVCIISIRQGDGYVVKRFIKSFKENFKQATLIWIPRMALFCVVLMDLLFWLKIGTPFAKVMFVLSLVVAFFLLMVGMYIFPVLAKLEGDVKTTLKNAAVFAVGYLPYTMILLVITGIFLYANLVSVEMNILSLFIGFAGVAYVKSFFIYKVMMNHIDERYDDFYQIDNA